METRSQNDAAPRAVLDTNVFVAAGFRPNSAAGSLVAMLRAGALVQVWSEATREETQHVLTKIPRLRFEDALFDEAGRYAGPVDPAAFDFVPDPADRKFAALAVAACVPLVSNDDDLLSVKARIAVPVLRSGEFLRSLDRAEG